MSHCSNDKRRRQKPTKSVGKLLKTKHKIWICFNLHSKNKSTKNKISSWKSPLGGLMCTHMQAMWLIVWLFESFGKKVWLYVKIWSKRTEVSKQKYRLKQSLAYWNNLSLPQLQVSFDYYYFFFFKLQFWCVCFTALQNKENFLKVANN